MRLLLILMIFSSQVTAQVWDNEKLAKATVQLLCCSIDNKNFGTGTIVKNENRYFILTADHVATEMNDSSMVVFYTRNVDKYGSTYLKWLTNHALEWKKHQFVDLAMCEIFPEKLGYLNIDFESVAFPLLHFLKKDEISEKKYEVTFIGYPPIRMDTINYSTKIYSGTLLNYSNDNFQDSTSESGLHVLYVSSPYISEYFDIGGCSGGGAYINDLETINTYLVGIISAYVSAKSGRKYVALTPSYYLVDIMKEFNIELNQK